ncbi:hypothetical protein PILCRDRAFT_826390 [Piloderma croceum F 1598]|uniref:Uncharacterized protein n=1 Tax=Piloderma croceum (strain F 1598) TaxID=765440 RepID=A0A0C3EV30_PILCF|nr:hypothetical protein PILCRDRAFT_826390 [Piloderma croceum F 1598]
MIIGTCHCRSLGIREVPPFPEQSVASLRMYFPAESIDHEKGRKFTTQSEIYQTYRRRLH